MKIFNTLTRKKEKLIPINKGEYKIYVCGPTVYNYIHIGNARPMTIFDVLRRYLEFKENKVNFVQNFTDIDDKLINEANKENVSYQEIAKKFTHEYEIDAHGLNVRNATKNPKATENIEEIIAFVKDLENKDFAYNIDGNVYFRTHMFKEYGKLSKQPLDELMSGARIDVDNEKENAVDFALWKKAKEGEPYWDSPWGKGRPGWHIECSAMAKKYLGDTIDIHAGGQDLIFPHHENEIAQSEAANDLPLANYFMHNGYINVDNKKMSKSDGNFFTVRDVAEEYGYEAIRYIMVSSYYKSPINYSKDVVIQAVSSLERLYTFRENLNFWSQNCINPQTSGYKQNVDKYLTKFIEAMDDDLNTADALGYIFEMVREINTKVKEGDFLSVEEYSYVKEKFDILVKDILGLLYKKQDEALDEEIDEMIANREKARLDKDFALADEIRDTLKNMGIKLEDTKQGVKWSRE